MTDVQENKFSMYNVVKVICQEFAAIWAVLPAFADSFANFQSRLTDIESIRQIQGRTSIGATQDKEASKALLVNQVVLVANAVFAFGSKSGNNTLKEDVRVTPSGLDALRDTTLKQKGQDVHDLANENVASLADYGIDAAKLTELQSRVDDYDAQISAPRETITRGKTATDMLVEQFVAADVILNDQMDKLMTQFKTSSPAFHDGYFNGRVIVDV